MERSVYVSLYQTILNILRSGLTPAEQAVLLFILERTLRFNKEWEYIPMRHFLNGVWMGNGELLHAGLNYSKSTIVKAYQSLVDKGLISKQGDTRNMFKINYEKVLAAAAEVTKMIKGLKPSKKRQGVTQKPTPVAKGVTQEPTPSFKEQKRDKYRNHAADAPKPRSRLREIIDNTTSTGEQRRERRAAALSDGNITIANLKAAWVIANKKHRSGQTRIAVSDKELSKIRNQWRTNNIDLPLREFIEWTVENWDELREKEMEWCTQMPSSPNFAFFGGMLKSFVKARDEFNNRHRRTFRKREKLDTEATKRAAELEKDLDRAAAKLASANRRKKELQRENTRLRREQTEKPTRRNADDTEIGGREVITPNLPEWKD